MKAIFHGRIRNGKTLWDPEDEAALRQRQRDLEGHEIEATFERAVRHKTDKQRKYYWAVIIEMLAEEFGYRKDEHQRLHEDLKRKFLLVPGEGKKLDTTRSTEMLTTREEEEYHNQIRMWALQEYGIVIPLPNEVAY